MTHLFALFLSVAYNALASFLALLVALACGVFIYVLHLFRRKMRNSADVLLHAITATQIAVGAIAVYLLWIVFVI